MLGSTTVVSIATRWLLVTGSVMTTVRPVGHGPDLEGHEPVPAEAADHDRVARCRCGSSCPGRSCRPCRPSRRARRGSGRCSSSGSSRMPISRPIRSAALNIVVDVEQIPPPMAPPCDAAAADDHAAVHEAALDRDRTDAAPEAEPLARREVAPVDVPRGDVDVVPEAVALTGNVVRRPARDHLHLRADRLGLGGRQRWLGDIDGQGHRADGRATGSPREDVQQVLRRARRRSACARPRPESRLRGHRSPRRRSGRSPVPG